MIKSPIRLAVIGLGTIAKFQLQALYQIRQFQIVAACDRNPLRQQTLSKNHLTDVIFFTNSQEMLDTIPCDAVLVSTPILDHYSTAKRVLQMGKNLLLEKPATQRLEEFQELIQLAHAQNSIFVIAFHAAFGLEICWLRKHQSTLFPGKSLTQFQSIFSDPYLQENHLIPSVESLGSSWLDSGINALSMINHWANNLKLESAKFQFLKKSPEAAPGKIDRNIQARVKYHFSSSQNPSTPGQGTINTHWNLGINRKLTRLQFYPSPQEIILDHNTQQVWLTIPGKKIELLADFSQSNHRLINHYIGVFTNFYNHLQNHTHNLELALHLHQHLYTIEQLSHQFS